MKGTIAEPVKPAVSELPTGAIRFVKELYPRLKPSDEAVERYRDALCNLPPIIVARDGVIVDGYHRWQAHVRENAATIRIENLGDLTDLEIRKESLRRNSSHGQQLETKDKRRQAGELYLLGVEEGELRELLSITVSTLETYLREAKTTQKQRQKDELCDRWLNCEWDSFTAAAQAIGVTDKTAKAWLSEFSDESVFSEAPQSRQHFDIWQFTTADKESGQQSYFGALPPQVVENLLWFYTEPGQILVDLFAGSGTTIDVAKAMGRRVWAADIRGNHYSPHLPIHKHDAVSGWPKDAPKSADLVLLDPPYWKQAAGRYSSEPNEMAEMPLERFETAWDAVVKAARAHTERVAYIVSPTQDDDGSVVDHATRLLAPFESAGWKVERRVIVPYQTQQATGQQVTWARENKRMLKLYRDLVVLHK